MKRPEQINTYPEVDFKLGIKSSLPNLKSTLALLMMFWYSENDTFELNYSKENGDKIILSDNLEMKLKSKYASIYQAVAITEADFIAKINENQMFKSQLESLIVPFELIWKLARIKFTTSKAASSERTGNKRYNKTLHYTKNMDIIGVLVSSNELEYNKILLRWLGFDVSIDSTLENSLISLLTYISEDAVYKTNDNGTDVIFNTLSVYEALSGNDFVDIDGDAEPKGSLRILKSLLTEGMNPFVKYSEKMVSVSDKSNTTRLSSYSKRLKAYLSLTNTRNFVDMNVPFEEVCSNINITIGENILIYGVPGCGKSHYIKENYDINDDNSERVVFHPDYTYSDFVGQILPQVANKSSDSDETIIKYGFVPGPFTRLLKECNKPENSNKMHYLVIEEINRGNAPAIFGEIFQLLDRDDNGKSEYGINNSDIADKVYGDPNKKVIIPNNLTILATMNTADQNVFTLDTAFKRRWEMLSIRNNFKIRENDDYFNAQLECTLCGTDLTWMKFATAINSSIVAQSESNLGSDDKRLGHFFVKKNEMKDINKFSEKVIMYLWNDVFKFEKENIFNSDYKTLEDVLDAFKEPSIRFKVFDDKLGFAEFIIVKDSQDEGGTDE